MRIKWDILKNGICPRVMWGAAVFWLFLPTAAQERIVDGILAVVNQQVITLTDLRVAQAFGLYYHIPDDSDAEPPPNRILERLIDQKLVIQMTNPDLRVRDDDLEAEYQRILSDLGSEDVQQRFFEFDIGREELSSYIRDKVLFQRIIDERFQMAVTVSLGEIESYYELTYVPQREAVGEEPEPMLEILDKLETALIREGTRRLIQEWIRNLRRQAEIQLFRDRYPDYFKKNPIRKDIHHGQHRIFVPRPSLPESGDGFGVL